MVASGRIAIICITYNHAQWIEETLDSVRLQDYRELQLIVVDNGSTDDTADKIRNWVAHFSGSLDVRTIFHTQSQPYCRLFNQVISAVDSQFLIDLSGDDVLYPQHVSTSIAALRASPEAAFSFSDATIMDYLGNVGRYYRRDHAGIATNIPDLKNLYTALISRSCISSPTLVFDAAILKKAGGYDESLFYEDFDILVRLARRHGAVFSDHIGVLKRKHAHSMSAAQYLPHRSNMLPSTVRVCEKIFQMNRSREENHALGLRIMFELKHALWSANFEPARNLIQLGRVLKLKNPVFRIYRMWARSELDISCLYLKLK